MILDDQFGFRKGRGTKDTMKMLRLISEITFVINVDVCRLVGSKTG